MFPLPSGPESRRAGPSGRGAPAGRAERRTRRFLLAAAVILAGLALLAALAPQLLDVPPSATGAVSWRPTGIGAAVLLGLLLWGLRGSWVLLGAGIAVFELPAMLAQPLGLAGLATLSQTLLAGMVLAFTGTVVLRLSRSADVAAAGRERAAAAAAAAAGAAAARARAAALVHDEVLSTLSLAGTPHLVERERLARQAERARGLLRDISADATRSTSTVATLREDVAALDADAEFLVRDGGPSVEISPVPSAVHGAVLHALRNSLDYAGAARRRVTVACAPAPFSVVVEDDGAGFDPAQVPEHRLGLRTAAEALRAIGGEARVMSAPGVGTRVAVEWEARPELGAPTRLWTDDAAWSDLDAADTLPELGRAPIVRTGVIAVASAFAVTQTALTAVAIASGRPWWLQLTVLTLLLSAATLLLSDYQHRIDSPRAALVLVLIAAALSAGLLGAPYAAGELWFAGAAAFLLTAVAFRGRPLMTACGGLLLSAALAASGIMHDASTFVIVSVSARPLGVTAFAVGLGLSVAALLRRIARDLAAVAAESARASWERGARAEQAAQADEVLRLVDGMLEEIARGLPLAAAARSRSQALEGRLRDRIRAGRLAREPLLSAVMRARQRGVDVLMLDDRESELPERFELHSALALLAAACAHARERVTVRLLPDGRATVVSLVVDGTPQSLAQQAESTAG